MKNKTIEVMKIIQLLPQILDPPLNLNFYQLLHLKIDAKTLARSQEF